MSRATANTVSTVNTNQTEKLLTKFEQVIKNAQALNDDLTQSISNIQVLKEEEEIKFGQQKEKYNVEVKEMNEKYKNLTVILNKEYEEKQYNIELEFQRRQLDKAKEVAASKDYVCIPVVDYNKLQKDATSTLDDVKKEMEKAIKEQVKDKTAQLTKDADLAKQQLLLLQKDLDLSVKELNNKINDNTRLQQEITNLQGTIVKVAEAGKSANINMSK